MTKSSDQPLAKPQIIPYQEADCEVHRITFLVSATDQKQKCRKFWLESPLRQRLQQWPGFLALRVFWRLEPHSRTQGSYRWECFSFLLPLSHNCIDILQVYSLSRELSKLETVEREFGISAVGPFYRQAGPYYLLFCINRCNTFEWFLIQGDISGKQPAGAKARSRRLWRQGQ